MTAKQHYDNHLGYFYSWMLGDFETKCHEQQTFFIHHHITPKSSKIAFDLGCGNGIQSIALARLGFSMTALDFNKTLLHELQERKGASHIEIIESDLLNFKKYVSSQPELITCMGDTITHLPNKESVEQLIREGAEILSLDGKLIISFRDLNHELTATQRFLPVRVDENRIHTCFLEYFPEHVMVHDILHEKLDGQWQMKISAYPKLKLSINWFEEVFKRNNMTICSSETINRMIHLVVQKIT